MKFILTIFILSSFSLFSQSWVQTAEIDDIKYREILNYGNSTYIFTNHSAKVGILRSTDDGASWDTLIDGNPKGYEEEFPSVSDLINENTAITCLGDQGNLFIYDFKNNTEEHIKLEATSNIMSIKMLDKVNGICATRSELFITEDAWKTSKKIEVNKLEEVFISKDGDNFIFSYLTSDEFLENKSRYYRSSDYGNNWSETIIGEIRALDMTIKEDESIYVTAGKNEQVDDVWVYSDLIYKSTDNGKTWEEKLKFTSEERVDLDDIKFYNNEIGIANGVSTSTYLTYDGGETWMKQEVGKIDELDPRPTFGGFTQTKFILGVWNNGLYQKSIATSSVNDEELIKKYKHTIVDNILSLENNQIVDFKIYSLAGQVVKQGITTDNINLNLLEKGVYLINVNNEYTIKFIR